MAGRETSGMWDASIHCAPFGHSTFCKAVKALNLALTVN